MDSGTAAVLAWSDLSAGRLMLIAQLERDGHREVRLQPCVDQASPRALTPIEDRIARLAGQALSNKEIGFALRMNQSAVENHLSRALRKLGLPDRVALARLYTQLEALGRV